MLASESKYIMNAKVRQDLRHHQQQKQSNHLTGDTNNAHPIAQR